MARISSKITYNDLTGGLNNVNTPDTINSSTRKTETPDIENVEYLKLGGIRSMDGNVRIGDKQSSAIVGGWEYTKGNTKYMLIALRTGEIKLYNIVTEVFDTIYTFSSNSNRVSFCNMNNGVVITNGIDEPIFYEYGRHQILQGVINTTINSKSVTGTSTKFTVELNPGDTIKVNNNVYFISKITDDTHLTLATNALETVSSANFYQDTISSCNATLINEADPTVHTPIRGRAIQYYNGRLWIGTDNGLFYSQVGQYNKWDIKYDAGVLYSIYNDTSEIKALGLYSDYMLIHKEYNTYLLNCTGAGETIQVAPYSNVSCDSQQSWIVSNTKYFVYSRENMDIYPLTQRTVYSDKFIGEALTKKVRDVFTNLRDAELENIFCVSYPSKRWMIFYMPMNDRLGSSYGLIYDWQTKSFLVRKVPQEVTIAFNYNNKVYLGTADGLVLREFSGDTFNGQAIVAYYKSPWFDWADGYAHSFAEFEINLAEELGQNFYIRTFRDGETPYEDRIISSELTSNDSLIWDEEQEAPPYSISFECIDGYDEDAQPVYRTISVIPDTNPDSTEDTTYTVNEQVWFEFVRNEDDLEIYTVDRITDTKELYITLNDYYNGIDIFTNISKDNNTKWDDDKWVSTAFRGLRMLLPNNVFENFQLEIGTDKIGQSFAIYSYQFRRLETEEAPW